MQRSADSSSVTVLLIQPCSVQIGTSGVHFHDPMQPYHEPTNPTHRKLEYLGPSQPNVTKFPVISSSGMPK